MKYTEFVKANYHKVSHLPHKDRLKEIGKLWRASGNHSKTKNIKGAGIGSTIGSLADSIFGFGMEPKKQHKTKKHHNKRVVEGGGIGSTIGSLADSIFGFGMEPQHKKVAGRPRKSKATGAGMFDPITQLNGQIANQLKAYKATHGFGLKSKSRKLKVAGHKTICPLCNHDADAKTIINSLINHNQLHGGSFASFMNSFTDHLLSGIRAPFDLAGKINPVLSFGIPQIADALGVKKLI